MKSLIFIIDSLYKLMEKSLNSDGLYRLPQRCVKVRASINDCLTTHLTSKLPFMRQIILLSVLVIGLGLNNCAHKEPHAKKSPKAKPLKVLSTSHGGASWYGKAFQ